MSKQPIHTPRAPAAIGPYSQAIRAGDTVYLSGQIPLVPATMELVKGDIRAQIRQVFDNLAAVAEASGGSLANAVRLTVYLTDLAHFPLVNEIMAEYCKRAVPRSRRDRRGEPAARRRRRSRRHPRVVGRRKSQSSPNPRSIGRSTASRASGRRWPSAWRSSAFAGSAISCACCRSATKIVRRRKPIGSLAVGDMALIEGVVELSELVVRRRRSLLCRLADGTGRGHAAVLPLHAIPAARFRARHAAALLRRSPRGSGRARARTPRASHRAPGRAGADGEPDAHLSDDGRIASADVAPARRARARAASPGTPPRFPGAAARDARAGAGGVADAGRRAGVPARAAARRGHGSAADGPASLLAAHRARGADRAAPVAAAIRGRRAHRARAPASGGGGGAREIPRRVAVRADGRAAKRVRRGRRRSSGERADEPAAARGRRLGQDGRRSHGRPDRGDRRLPDRRHGADGAVGGAALRELRPLAHAARRRRAAAARLATGAHACRARWLRSPMVARPSSSARTRCSRRAWSSRSSRS